MFHNFWIDPLIAVPPSFPLSLIRFYSRGKGEKAAFISVNVQKMDQLMDLIGELVISESVVLQNPDLKVPGLNLANFNKAASQMAKIDRKSVV